MKGETTAACPRNHQRGLTLVTCALALVVMLGVAALAIDLVWLYLARSEAQRAGDAAALAGAETFVSSGFTGGLISQSAVQSLATDQAIAAGNKNLVGGQSPALVAADVNIDFSAAGDPRITVNVQRTAAHGNPMPLFFGRILGLRTANVSTTSTAEAYNGGGMPFFTQCWKPLIIPNCDPTHPTPTNPSCTTGATFINPTTGQVTNPGPAPGGVIGATLTLARGDPTQMSGAGMYFPADPSQASQALINCSVCSTVGSSYYEQTLTCCNVNQWTCGNQNLPPYLKPLTDPKIAQTFNAVSCMIHEPGQDTLIINPPGSASPFSVLGGSSNPNPALRGKTYMFPPTDSIVNVPLAAGGVLCPGGSCPDTVNLVGFAQLFIQSIDASATMRAVVLSITKCPSGPPPGSGAGAMGLTAVPVRLIQPRQ